MSLSQKILLWVLWSLLGFYRALVACILYCNGFLVTTCESFAVFFFIAYYSLILTFILATGLEI